MCSRVTPAGKCHGETAMSDLLFCASAQDIDRVKPIEQQVRELDYQVSTYHFRDYQTVETQKIRALLHNSRVVVLFWSSKTSLTIEFYKLIQPLLGAHDMIHVTLDPGRSIPLPDEIDGERLIALNSDKLYDENPEWEKFIQAVGRQVVPLWMGSALERKEAEISALMEKHEEARDHQAKLGKLLATGESALDEARGRVNRLSGEVEDLEGKTLSLETMLADERKNTTRLETALKKVEAKSYTHGNLASVAVLCAALGALGAYLPFLRPIEYRAEQAEAVARELRAADLKQKGVILGLEGRLEAEMLRAEQSEAQGRQLKSDLDRSEEALKASQAKAAQWKQLLRDNETRLEELTAKLNQIEKQKGQTETQYAETNTQLRDAQSSLFEVRQELQKAEARLALVDVEISEVKTNALKEIAEVKEKAAKDIAGLTKRVKELQQRLAKKK